MCQFFYTQRASARCAQELQIATCSQHRSLADDNLKKGHSNLANVRSTRKDLVGVPADVTRLVQCDLSALELAEAQCQHVKESIYMSFTFVSLTLN